jgi:hypothetical protein
MSKRENHKRDLVRLLREFAQTGDAEGITGYIVSNSNLPGRRANLELAGAFGDAVGEYAGQAQRLSSLCISMTTVSADEAPANTPEEFIPFCGAIGVGALGSVCPEFFDQALITLQALAKDPRWRMREAVRFALQRLLAERRGETLEALDGWITGGDLLEMRAVAATVAEPALLQDRDTAVSALQLHARITDQVLVVQERKSDAFRILRKGLGYTLSVVVCAVPDDGFEYLAQLAASQDPDVRWIVKENLKKNRLVKGFPADVEALNALL